MEVVLISQESTTKDVRLVQLWYGTLVRLVRTINQCTKIPYPYFHKQHVPYFWAKIEAYSTYVSYRTGILGCQCLQRRNGKIVTFLTCRLQIWFPFPNLFFVKISQLNTEFNVFYVFSKSWWISCKLLLRIFEKPCWSNVKTKWPLSFCKASYCFHGMAKLLPDISFNSIFLK